MCEIARVYEEAGYQQVVATPHAEVDSLPSKDYSISIRTGVHRLNSYLEKLNSVVKVLPGMEVGLDPQLPEMVTQGAILTLADTNYLLVETPFNRLPVNWWEIVFSLASGGITVVFAHPERCAQVGDSFELVQRMFMSGAKFQVNWDSFAGAYGRGVANMARRMARKGFIHCLATDSHDIYRRHAGTVRSIAFQLKGLIGSENLRRIAVINPAKVIRGEALLEMDLEEIPLQARRTTVGEKLRSRMVVRRPRSIAGER